MELRKKAERSKKSMVQDEMYFEQEKQLFCGQLKAVRDALKSSQVECDMVKKELDKEVSFHFIYQATDTKLLSAFARGGGINVSQVNKVALWWALVSAGMGDQIYLPVQEIYLCL